MDAHLSAVLKSIALIGGLLAAFMLALNFLIGFSVIAAGILFFMITIFLFIFAASINGKEKESEDKIIESPVEIKEVNESKSEPKDKSETINDSSEEIEEESGEELEEEKERKLIDSFVRADIEADEELESEEEDEKE